MLRPRVGNTFHTKNDIWKNFEAEGHTDWKSKKEGLHIRRCPTFSTEIGEERKKGLYVPGVLFFPLKIGEEQKKKKKRFEAPFGKI